MYYRHNRWVSWVQECGAISIGKLRGQPLMIWGCRRKSRKKNWRSFSRKKNLKGPSSGKKLKRLLRGKKSCPIFSPLPPQIINGRPLTLTIRTQSRSSIFCFSPQLGQGWEVVSWTPTFGSYGTPYPPCTRSSIYFPLYRASFMLESHMPFEPC